MSGRFLAISFALTLVLSNNVWIAGYEGRIYRKQFPTNAEQDETADLPTRLYLGQNYPNPFNPTTRIDFNLPFQSSDIAEGRAGEGSNHVTLTVYDILGRDVVTLVNKQLAPGSYTVQWGFDTCWKWNILLSARKQRSASNQEDVVHKIGTI